MTDSTQRGRSGATPDLAREAAIKAKALLAKIQALSQEITTVKTSLQPFQILLEACCANVADATAGENILFFAELPQRSDIEKRWIDIFVEEGLIKQNARGQISLSDKGLAKFEACSSIL